MDADVIILGHRPTVIGRPGQRPRGVDHRRI